MRNCAKSRDEIFAELVFERLIDFGLKKLNKFEVN